ncbi:MAG TPA: thioredoxin-disulfide reductase [Limnochordia bacterium]
MEQVIILGSGPAGLTAALYCARANLSPLVIEGYEPGGQLTLTTLVENFPGFPEGIMGPDLMAAMKEQAARFGARFVSGAATAADLAGRPLRIAVEETWYECKALIVATGASARTLGLPAEKRLMGRGVSTCATCDGYFFRGKKVIVVGGGDSAMEEAIFLTKFAEEVCVVHRRDTLRASKVMQERARQNPKIRFQWNTVVEDLLGEEKLTAARLRDLTSGRTWDEPVDGLFYAIGHIPNTELFRDQLELDERGYIRVHNRTRTNIPGVFVAGDVQDFLYRQAVTAAGSGCMAAIDVEKYLEEAD